MAAPSTAAGPSPTQPAQLAPGPLAGLVAPIASLIKGVVALVTAPLVLLGAPVAAGGPTAPAGPLQSVLELFWAARRLLGLGVFDTLPTANPLQYNTSGTVIGMLGATDAEADQLTYTVTQGPANGSLIVDGDGFYNYTPSSALAATGGTDTFTVEVDDNIRSLIQIGAGGLRLSLFSSTGSISVPVTVTVAKSGAAAVAVGTDPQGVAVSPDGTRAYVTNAGSNTVSVIATATNRVIGTIAVGGFPAAVAVAPGAATAYVVNAETNTVSVIDTATNRVTATVAVGDTPLGVVVSPVGDRAYVVNAQGNTISVLNTTTNAVSKTLAAGDSPQGVAITPDGTRLYVANGTGTVSVIDTATGAKNAIPITGSPGAVAITPDGTRVYVATDAGTVAVIDTTTNTVVDSIGIGDRPTGLAISPDGTRVYVTDVGPNAVTVINTASNATIDTVGASSVVPGAVAVSNDGTHIYVTNAAEGSVSVIDTATIAPAPGPAATVGTVKFVVRNLSGKPIRFSGYDNAKAAFLGPKVGTIIPVGGTVTFGVVPSSSGNEIRPQFGSGTAPEPFYRLSLTARGTTLSPTLQTVSCNTASNGACAKQDGIANGRGDQFAVGTATLLNKPGTVVEIPTAQAQQQAGVLGLLCFKDAGQKCGLILSSQIQTFNAVHQVGDTVRNDGSRDLLTKTRRDDTVSETESFSVTSKVQLGIKDVIATEIMAMYGRSYTKTATFSMEFDVTTPPGYESMITVQDPVYRVTGDFKVTAYNTTFILRDVYFDTPDPSRRAKFVVSDMPVSVQQP